MSKVVYPLHYGCFHCNASATFYDFYGADTEAFRQYHFEDKACISKEAQRVIAMALHPAGKGL